ncbi:type II/IV secretion system protein [Patescibacteria group bacterium]|nr:MAG: type II/IV secretion system protein [Patescibacteria group bacterium]
MSDFPSINSLLKGPGGAKKPAQKTAKGEESAEEKFEQKMKTLDIKAREELAGAAAASASLPFIDLSKFPISSEALSAIPEKTARDKKIICFYFSPEDARLACVEPGDEIKELVYQFGERHHVAARLYLISQHSFDSVLKLYTNLPQIKPISKDINITDEELEKFKANVTDFRDLKTLFENVSITDILTLMVASALKVNSSDIHVEAEENGIAVRYRIDGVLHDVAVLPKEQWKRFVSRIKLLAALKINITDKPQDGRVTLRLSSGTLDVRVSTMPTTWGESVVMRILHSSQKGVTFDELGLLGSAYDKLKREMERPNGMIITTGPTGSGKTTTMYAIMRALNKPGVKIITLEDPVEIKMEGINQSQVDPGRDYTFAKGLRSLLRQDPDICMVGEIRDLETADIAIQAALTGHLMLSTVHTNDASGAVPRFLSMGVKPFLLAPAINSVIGQRLVRRVCPSCMEEDKLDNEKMARAAEILGSLPPGKKTKIDLKNLQFYRGRGCAGCSGLGYKGRIGIYEIFTMNKELEQTILGAQVSEYVIKELAVKSGMVTMAQDGLLKALQKITSVEEVFRVTE